jgi:hypothetical protein
MRNQCSAASLTPCFLSGAQLLSVCMLLWGVFYMFWALAIVCDDYFVSSLEDIAQALRMSPGAPRLSRCIARTGPLALRGRASRPCGLGGEKRISALMGVCPAGSSVAVTL